MKQIGIVNCMDCPHHVQETSPPTGDSFDYPADQDVFCTKVKPKKAVTAGTRFYQLRQECSIPKWCPL